LLLVAAMPVTTAGAAGPEATTHDQSMRAARVEPAPDNLSNAELLSQDLTVWLYPENHSIAVEGSLRLRANFALSKLTLYLYETLDLLNITQDGQPLLYTRNIERLTIDLASPLAADATTNLSFYYNGTMWYTENGARQDCVGWEGAYLKGSTFWYLRHHASDWFDCRLKLCCPPNWTAVADGDLVAEEHTAEWANYTWVNDLPCLRPAFAAGNYSIASKAAWGINFSVYTYPEHTGLATGYLEEAVDIMATYEGWIGPYGRRSFKIVETAHETSTGYACSGFVMLWPGAFTKGVVDHGLIAHEMGHQWFPFATGYQGWAYAWLWEAFPEYLACLSEGYGPMPRLMKDYKAYVDVHGKPGLPSIYNSTWDTPYSYEIVYAKGAWVLRMLDGILQGWGFVPLLKEYIDTYRWGYGSVSGFIALAAKHSTTNLDAFWEQWLNTTMDLDVSLPAARQYENGTSFRLELEPVNLLEASNPVDIRIAYNDGNWEDWPKAWDGKVKRLVLDVPTSVEQVYLDPSGWLLDVDRNNQAAVPLQSGKMYELRPEPPSCPGNLIEGVEATITAPINNDGVYDARGVGVDLLVDGIPTASASVNISAYGRTQAGFAWRTERGQHKITVAVDVGDMFHEWNELDNNDSITIEVAPPPPRQDVWLGNLSFGDVLMEGQQYAINVTVRNAGEVPLGIINLDYYLDGSSFGYRVVPHLAVGDEASISLMWTATRGYHNISVWASPEGYIQEVDEENNVVNHSFFVRWQDKLQVNFTPQDPRTLEPVTFSVEGDAEEFHYLWGDDTASQWTAERVVVHTFLECGRHTVIVEGRVAGWVVADASIDMSVSNRPPEVAAYYDPASPLSLSTVIFTARTLDLDGTVVSVHWDFGDGANGTGNRAEHSYSRPGNYTVNCTARDDKRGENATSLRVTIGNRPPTIGWTGAPSGLVGEKLNFTANASDPDGNVTLCRWQFGDGSSANGPNVSHSYSKPGIYLVTVTVWDDSGSCGNLSGSVEVKGRKTAGPAQQPWMWVPVPIVITVVVAALFLLRRRGLARQHDDFFQPPPRDGQNP
jgi:PKD repeat protein